MSCTNCGKNEKTGVKFSDYKSENLYTWCTNCGNYGIHTAIKRALIAEGVLPKDTLLVFDIGCNGNGADKIDAAYRFKGLHGRAIPFAAGASMANRRMTVIASGGDGATLGEGVNHLIHAVRSNYNMTFLLHNNSNYGLTTGQASSTTKKGVKMNISPDGVVEQNLNVADFIFSLSPTFYARGFSGNVPQLSEIIRAGMQHKGFSFIEILQNCPTYNKETPHSLYMERIYDVSKVRSYDSSNFDTARAIAKELENRIATGVLYLAPEDQRREDFLSASVNRVDYKTELVDEVENRDITNLVQRFV